MNNFRVCELFKSIQGESTWTGSVCSFIRLSGCNLRCSYCDTLYAFDEYHEMSESSIIDTLLTHKTTLVEITGGEPLLDSKTPSLCTTLLKLNYTVLVETNGSLDISALPENCIRIVDVKCPGSGMADSFLESNFLHLKSRDEIKYVISDRSDFDWALLHVRSRELNKRCTVLFSPNLSSVSAQECASWILGSDAPVRLGVQLHRLIWGDRRGI